MIVGGLSDSAPWIAKYSNTGGLVWLSTTNTGDVRYSGIGIDSSNNYYAAGRTKRNDLSNPADTNKSNAVVEKYDSNGNPLWGKSVSIGAENASFQKVDVSDTSVICAGYIEDDVTKGYFAKYDSSSGVLQWDRTLESKEIDGLGVQEKTSIEDIHVDSDGFIYLCGVLSFGEVESNTFNQSRGFITKYTPEGNQLWCREVGTPNFTGFVQYYNIKVDDNTKQVIVFGISSNTNSTKSGLLTKLSSSGEILWHRELLTDRVPPTLNEFQRRVGFDADASFYYIFFTDDDFNKVSGNPDEYTFGKVSSSGNGLGSFVYNPEVGIDIEYTITTLADRIGKLQDGSVRNDSSDFISYPFNGTKIMFDDLATPVTNKKAIISDKDIILRSGSPAIRPTDFQELNLLGNVYSGSGDWLDQSGNGNDATTSFTITTTTGGTTSSENFGTGGSITYDTYGTVVEDATTTLPYSTSDWTHYGGKARDLQSGGFKITTSNGATTDFFMGCWVKFDTYQDSRQMGIDLDGNYIYWETRSNGKIGIRHDGGSRSDSAETNINDGNWHYISLSRNGNTLSGFLDGTVVVSTTDGVSGNSVPANADFWFFGGSGTSYNIDGKILDPIININTGSSGGFNTPTKPIIDSSGNFNDGSSGSGPFFNSSWEYASPAISFAGSPTTTTNSPTHNAAGYWEFDRVDDYISVDTLPDFDTITVEMWSTFNQSFDLPQYRAGVIKTSDANWPDGFGFYEFANATNNTRVFSWFVNAYSGSQRIDVDVSSSEYTQFTHWVGTYDGSNTKLYKNGVLLDTSAYTAAMVNSDKHLFIGGGESTPYTANVAGGSDIYWWWDGDIGDVRIYPRALTAEQVFQNYNATKSKYINEAPDTAPKIGPGIVHGSNLLLNYDFGNRATYDRATNLIAESIVDPNSGLTSPAYWTPQEFSSPTQVTDPFGSNNAYQYLSVGGNVRSRILSAGSSNPTQPDSVVGEQYTFSIFVKPINFDTVQFGASAPPWTNGTGNTRVLFNLTTGTLVSDISNMGSVSSASMIPYGDGWWRLVVTTIPATAADSLRLYVDLGGGGAQQHTTSEGLQLFGAQIEAGTTVGRPIRTYGSAITAPTTVKNLSSSSYTGILNGVEFDTDGYFEFPSDGTTLNEITIPNFTGFTGGNNPYSYGFWIRSSGSSADNDEVPFFYGSQATGQALRIRYYDSGDITLGHWGGAGYDFSAGTVVSNVLEWNHIYETYDGTTNRLYVNGVDVFDATPNALSIPASATLILGHRPSAGAGTTNSDFGGDIGELQVYNKTLSATEVLQNFNATRGKYGV